MKKLGFILAMLCAYAGSAFRPMYAMQDQKINEMALVRASASKAPLFLTIENSVRHQEIVKNMCQIMGMDSQKIILKIGERPGSGAGRLEDNSSNSFVVYLGTDELSISRHEMLFVLAHEFAHIKNKEKDDFERKVLVGGSMISLGALGFTLIKMGLRFAEKMEPVKGAALVLLMSGAFVYACPLLTQPGAEALMKRKEKRADLTAIAALNDKRGAIDYFNRRCEEHKKIRRARIQQGLASAFEIDEQGNNLKDNAHPLLTERIAYCNAALP